MAFVEYGKYIFTSQLSKIHFPVPFFHNAKIMVLWLHQCGWPAISAFFVSVRQGNPKAGI